LQLFYRVGQQWFIGIIQTYNISQQTWKILWSDRTTETFDISVLSAIWFGPPLPPCFSLAFDLLESPSVLQHFAARSALVCDHTQQESFLVDHPAVPDLPYSPAAQDIFVSFLSSVGLLTTPQNEDQVRSVVPNPQFPLAGSRIFIPKTDRQAQLQPDAEYYNAAKRVRLARHDELKVHSWVDKPQGALILRTKHVFDVKIDPATRMIDRYKCRIVCDGGPQIPGVDCYDTRSSTASMQQIKVQLAEAARLDQDLFVLDTTTAFICADLRPEVDGEIYCYPPPGTEAPLGLDGQPQIWLLHRPLEGTRAASKRWQDSDQAEPPRRAGP
jgi:hypothetical protein